MLKSRPLDRGAIGSPKSGDRDRRPKAISSKLAFPATRSTRGPTKPTVLYFSVCLHSSAGSLSGAFKRKIDVTYLTASTVVLMAMGAAALVSWLFGRLVPIAMRQSHHEVASSVFSQVGTLIAVLLAFIFSAVWSDFRTAAEAINGECGALHGAIMMANALPDEEGLPVARAIATYADIVIRNEWPAMAARRRSPSAARAIPICRR